MGNKPIPQRPSPEKIREAVVLISGGRRTTSEMAKAVGCSERTLERALKAYRDAQAKAKVEAPKPDESPATSSPAAAPEGDSEIERARRAAGLGAPSSPAAPAITPREVDLAAKADRKKREDYCVDQIRQNKGLLVFGAGVMLMRIPMAEERLQKACELSPMAEDSIRSAADELEPILRKYCQGGLWGVAIALLFDLKGTWDKISDLADEYRAARKKEREKNAPKDPPKPAEAAA